MKTTDKDNPYATPETISGDPATDSQVLQSQENIWMGLLGGFTGMVAAVLAYLLFFWAFRQIGPMIVFIGPMVACAVRLMGRGIDWRFGIIGLVATLLATMICVALVFPGALWLLLLPASLASGFLLSFRKLSFDQERNLYRDQIAESPPVARTGGKAPGLTRRRARRKR